MVGRRANVVVLSATDRAFLETQVRRHKAPRPLSDRCRMVLLCADGLQSKEVAERLGVHEHMVGKWRRRFAQSGLEGLTDEYRAGRPRTVSVCLIPRFDGAILSLEWKEAAWDRYVTGAPRPRTPSEQQYSDRKLRSRR